LREDRPLLLSMIRRILGEFAGVVHEPLDTMRARMHKLRGSAEVIGAHGVAAAAARVEAASRADDDDAVHQALGELERRLQALAQAARPALADEDQRLAAAQADLIRQSVASPPASPAAMHELRELVVNQSAKARRQAHAMAPALVVDLGADGVARLLAALDEFDFSRAASELGIDRTD